MSAEQKAAQEQLREIVRDLEGNRFRLIGVRESLPASVAERVRFAEVEEADPTTEIRTVIQCVLKDSLGPAIEDLRDLLKPPVPEPGEERE
jgi:hypothetical protein